MYSDHPSVQQEKSRSNFNKMKRKVQYMVNTYKSSERSSSYDDEEKDSNEEEGEEQQEDAEAEEKRLKEEARMANAAGNIKKD